VRRGERSLRSRWRNRRLVLFAIGSLPDFASFRQLGVTGTLIIMLGTFRLVYNYFTYWRQSRKLERVLRQRLEQEVAVARVLLNRAKEQREALERLHHLNRTALAKAANIEVPATTREASEALAAHGERARAAGPAHGAPAASNLEWKDPRVIQAARQVSEVLKEELLQFRKGGGSEGLREFLLQKIRDTGASSEHVAQLMQQIAKDMEKHGKGRALSPAQQARLLAEVKGEALDTTSSSPKP
jgi:hypothetical protein